MHTVYLRRIILAGSTLLLSSSFLLAQTSLKPKYNNSSVFAGIEVGAKGVKLSVVEVGKNAQSNGSFNIMKDTSVNTDFITFSQPTSDATLEGLYSLYNKAIVDYKIPSNRVYTVVSSGVKMQAEKDNKTADVTALISSFKTKIKEPERNVEVVDVLQEARLSHLGIIPESRRYTTFLIDIGSGNTKGGYFPYGNTDQFKLFQLNWGTKSTANATEKRTDEFDKTLTNYNKQLYRVLATAENTELIYAVNASGAYPLSDNVAFSGGIAWAVATLLHPEQYGKNAVSVSFEEVTKFADLLYSNIKMFSDTEIPNRVPEDVDKIALAKEVKRVNTVFDQRALMAGTGLMLKIMRQFASIYESKQFILIKNGQVGWISAYVDQAIQK